MKIRWCVLLSLSCFVCAITKGPLASDPPSPTGHYLKGMAPSHDTVIVFVNGIFGNDVDTWTSSNGKYWPEMMAADPDFQGADIYLYSFYSPKLGQAQTVEQLATRMSDYLTADHVLKHRRLIFLCHSMGGLVTRQFLVKSKLPAKKLPLIYFFATPSQGANIASLAQHMLNNPQLKDMMVLDGNDGPYVEQLAQDWLATAADEKLDYPDSIASYCAYEKYDTWGVRVVPESSAIYLCNRMFRAVMANHLDIVKPSSERDERYVMFKSAYLDTMTKPQVGPGSLGHLASGGGDYGWPKRAFKIQTRIANVDASAGEQKRGDVDLKFGLGQDEEVLAGFAYVVQKPKNADVWVATSRLSESTITVRYWIKCEKSESCGAQIAADAGIGHGEAGESSHR
jgi:hypothetical protein